MHVVSEEVDGGDIVHVHAPLRFHRVRWIFRLVYGFDDLEMTLVTSSFSLLSKPILDLFQIKWAFHWMNPIWIGSHSYPRSYIVVDHPYSHFNAPDRAGNDGRSGHDLDLHGHERDVKRVFSHPIASFPNQSILWLYLMDHRAHATHLSSPCHSVPSLLQSRHRSHPHHRPFQLACLSSGISSRVSRRSFG